jgi:hypothetical protein
VLLLPYSVDERAENLIEVLRDKLRSANPASYPYRCA